MYEKRFLSGSPIMKMIIKAKIKRRKIYTFLINCENLNVAVESCVILMHLLLCEDIQIDASILSNVL